ncbi:hypothetical protein CMQ_8257 [Grosmannia clavigera kw1407]|uniref:Uncharacterized protein n=1 Tax=Grosmannia clavigera (strain kw1407 / UAMH 11150) TaxID=655863 RepID=F0XKP8_GROCL|nr:uncharacterized protein CMQ_8257 [Grosmannia clavigera kw1407]EFX01791.1 hypothetical protein CMQ_8257 [Grosmannia clavigera kw1407]
MASGENERNGGKIDNRNSSIQDLREAYAMALTDDGESGRLFDSLRFVPYQKFRAANQIPRSSMHLTAEYTPKSHSKENSESAVDFVVFFSYRWMRPGMLSPDDDNHTQYGRMLLALESFFEMNPSISPQRLGVWVDYACIDQDNAQARQSGISTLPLILVQCDALISLTSNGYYDRAWCTLEVDMARSLIMSYGVHKWFVYDATEMAEIGKGPRKLYLQSGPIQKLASSLSDKKCSQPSDWPTLIFLERQTQLLGRG